MAAHCLHHLAPGFGCVSAIRQGAERVGAKVRRQHDQRLLEIDGAAVAIGQDAIIQHLQQDVEDIGVGLFHLVEQDDLIGLAPHGLGQDTAFVIADIAGGRADQTGYGVLFHEFRHVDADHRGFVIEQIFGQRLGQFGLADPGGAEEEERPQRAAFVVQPGAGAADGF